MSKSGGRSHPVSAGESNRATQPDGAIRKARPNAAAACGTDSSGDSIRSNTLNDRVLDQPAVMNTTMASDTLVAMRPDITESRTAAPSPAHPNKFRNGSRDGPVRPAAGKCPKAGRAVPQRPATTGPNIASSVSAGRKRSMIAFYRP